MHERKRHFHPPCSREAPSECRSGNGSNLNFFGTRSDGFDTIPTLRRPASAAYQRGETWERFRRKDVISRRLAGKLLNGSEPMFALLGLNIELQGHAEYIVARQGVPVT